MRKHDLKQSVALSSVIASAFLTFGKLIIGLLTGSIGIISEALHSALDFIAALLTFFAVRIGDQPADKRHPYGHAKVESVSALIETGLLFLTSAWIIYEAIKRLFFLPAKVEVTWYAIAIIIISIAVDFSRSRALSKVAKSTGSQALEADALHFSSDILSSSVVLVGLLAVYFGFDKGDAIAAIGVSLFVLHAGYELGKRTIDVLVDAAPIEIYDKVIKLVKKVDGVVDVDLLRIRPVGSTMFIEMMVSISRKLPLEKTHEISKNITDEIRKVIHEAETIISVKPLSLDTETIIERVQIIAANHGLSVHDIAVHSQDGKKYLSFDLEVGSDLTLDKAHEKSVHLERSIINEIGDNVDINTHIEPFISDIVTGHRVDELEEDKTQKIIKEIISEFKIIHGVHKIKIREVKKKIFISIHCLFENRIKLEKAHSVATKLEYMIKERLPEVERAVIHVEPV